MSLLLTYKRAAPFSAEEIVRVVNELLGIKKVQGLTKRALRFYVSRGILPAAIGPSRHARYGYEHLLRVLIIRMMQLKNYDLHRIQEAMEGYMNLEGSELEKDVEKWLHEGIVETDVVRESSQKYRTKYKKESSSDELGWKGFRKIKLTSNVSLEISGEHCLEEELRSAQKELAKVLKKLLSPN